MTIAARQDFLVLFLLPKLCQQLWDTTTAASIAFLLLTLIFFPYILQKIGCPQYREVFSWVRDISYFRCFKEKEDIVKRTSRVKANVPHKFPETGVCTPVTHTASLEWLGLLGGQDQFFWWLLNVSTHTQGTQAQTKLTLPSYWVITTFSHYWPRLELNWSPRDNILVQFYSI